MTSNYLIKQREDLIDYNKADQICSLQERNKRSLIYKDKFSKPIKNADKCTMKNTRTLTESLVAVDRQIKYYENDERKNNFFKTSILKTQDKFLSENQLFIKDKMSTALEVDDGFDYNSVGYTSEKTSAQGMFYDRINSHSFSDSESKLSFIDGHDSNSLQIDPLVITKILVLQKKLSNLLDGIAYELDRIPLPDGDNDLLRRQQRLMEFSTRLSRNYLYDLNRYITEIKRHMEFLMLIKKNKLSNNEAIIHAQALEQKLISTYQLLFNGLNAYCKHIPGMILKANHEKLNELLKKVIQLQNICIQLKFAFDLSFIGDGTDIFFNREIESKCSNIFKKFQLSSDNESQALIQTARSISSMKKQSNKSLAQRLSMYCLNMQKLKNSSKKKLNPESNRNVYSKINKKNKEKNFQCLARPQRVIKKNSKFTISSREDDVRTVMDFIPAYEDEINTNRSLIFQVDKKNSKDSVRKNSDYENMEDLIEKKIDSNSIKSNETINERCLLSVVPVIGDLITLMEREKQISDSTETVCKFFQKYQENINLNEKKRTNENGSKNIQLHCYSEENTKYSNEINSKVTHLKKNGFCTLVISDITKSDIMDWRNDFKSMQLSNPMYTSNTKNKPWNVIGWIADKLIDELIIELSKEIDMDDILEKLFNLEFKDL